MTESNDVVVTGTFPSEQHIPKFEGEEVKATKAQITSVSALEIADRVFPIDRIVKLVVEGRVLNVQHKVNQTSGDLERIHTIKAIDALVLDTDLTLADVRDGLS